MTFGPALVRVAPGATISDGSLGRIIDERLRENDAVAAEYDITWEKEADFYFRVILTPKAGKTPRVVRDGVTLSPGSNNLYLAAAVNPLSGDAKFNLSGAVTGESGEVFLGVNRLVVDVPTSDSMRPKAWIKSRLI